MCSRAWLGLQVLSKNRGGNCFRKTDEQKRTQLQKSLVGERRKAKDRDFFLYCYYLRTDAHDPSEGSK